MINYPNARGIVAGLKIIMSTSSITSIYFNNFIIRNTISVTVVEGIMSDIMGSIS